MVIKINDCIYCLTNVIAFDGNRHVERAQQR